MIATVGTPSWGDGGNARARRGVVAAVRRRGGGRRRRGRGERPRTQGPRGRQSRGGPAPGDDGSKHGYRQQDGSPSRRRRRGAFVVFRDPLTARRALTSLKRTTRGALVALAWHAWMLPFAAARALAPGFGGGRGFRNRWIRTSGPRREAEPTAAAAATRRRATRHRVRRRRRRRAASRRPQDNHAVIVHDEQMGDFRARMGADEFAADDSASFDDVFGAGEATLRGVTGRGRRRSGVVRPEARCPPRWRSPWAPARTTGESITRPSPDPERARTRASRRAEPVREAVGRRQRRDVSRRLCSSRARRSSRS